MDHVVPPGVPVRVAGWIYLRIEGEPATRGFQHGLALASEIHAALDAADYLARWDTGQGMEFHATGAKEMFGKLEEEYEQEIIGIVEGVDQALGSVTPGGVPVTRDVLVAWNGLLELVGYWWPEGPSPDTPTAGRVKGGLERCSAFIATGAATVGGIVMAHNTWDRYALGDHFNVVLDVVPPRGDGHRVIMQAAPGYITSNMDWFVNAAGLMITETTIGSFVKRPIRGKSPEFLRSRKAAQYGHDIDSWRTLLAENNNGGYANTWLVGEAHTGRIARLDLGLKYQGFERKDDGYYAGYNVAADLLVRNQECGRPDAYSDIRGNGSRRVRFDQLLGSSPVDVEQAKRIIGDHYDVLRRKDEPCSRSICGHLALDDALLGNHGRGPYYPSGANDGKVMDSRMAGNMTFEGRWGNSCGLPFDAKAFLAEHRQYDWLDGRMRDRPSRSWAEFPPLVFPPSNSGP